MQHGSAKCRIPTAKNRLRLIFVCHFYLRQWLCVVYHLNSFSDSSTNEEKNNAINYGKSIQHTVPLEIQTRTLKHLEKDDDEIAFYE